MTDNIQIIHMGITVVIAAGVAWVNYLNWRDNRAHKRQVSSDDFEQRIITIEKNYAVISERITNETHLLEKLDCRMDDLYQALLEDR